MPDLVSAGPGMRGQPRGIRSMPSESEKKKSKPKKGRGVTESNLHLITTVCDSIPSIALRYHGGEKGE